MSFAITATVVAVGATTASLVTGAKARSAQRKANRVQDKVRQTQDARARVAQIRQARMAQAQVLQSGATQGAMQSSAVQGGFSAIGSNAENNIQFINQVDTLQEAINKRMSQANRFSGAASALGGIASIAGNFTGGAPPNNNTGN